MHILKQGYSRVETGSKTKFEYSGDIMHIMHIEGGRSGLILGIRMPKMSVWVIFGLLRWGEALAIVLNQKFRLFCFLL